MDETETIGYLGRVGGGDRSRQRASHLQRRRVGAVESTDDGQDANEITHSKTVIGQDKLGEMSHAAAAHGVWYVIRRIVVAVATSRRGKVEDDSRAIDGAQQTLLKSSRRPCILVELLVQKADNCVW